MLAVMSRTPPSRVQKKCPYCSSSDIITDITAGDEICRSCATVLAERVICEEAEWRSYENDDRGSRDLARCGGKSGGLADLEESVILGGKSSFRKALTRAHISHSNSGLDIKMSENTSQVYDLCARLELPPCVSVS